ncbi:MAG: hypothetical protein ABFD86_00325 [Bryobacteraceae bacterium]
MPKGDLDIQITLLTGEPVRDRVEMELRPFPGEPGTGGEEMAVSIDMGDAVDLLVTGITCRAGLGTMYRLAVSAPHYRDYSFFQLIQENAVNTASDDVEFWVKPGDVRDLLAPGFDDLAEPVRAILRGADMRAVESEDQDLLGTSGASLYQKLGPLRKACLLNIAKKASHASADSCLPLIGGLLLCRQDRFFATADSSLPALLRSSPLYKSAPETLHDPLPGFELAEGSFKTRDAHANLQVTFMRNTQTDELAADIDIDESAGIEHGFEVIRNAIFQQRTNPYLIREFMLSADLIEHTLDPGYRFVVGRRRAGRTGHGAS